jgi:hypothetical protein
MIRIEILRDLKLRRFLRKIVRLEINRSPNTAFQPESARVGSQPLADELQVIKCHSFSGDVFIYVDTGDIDQTWKKQSRQEDWC